MLCLHLLIIYKTGKPDRILGLRIFFVFRRPQNSNSGCHKTTISINKVPFNLLPWVRLINANTNAKEPQMSWSKPPKKSFSVSFVASGMKKKVEFFSVFPLCYLVLVLC